MSLSSSLNAGVMGLNVNSTRLAVISDNIANSSTNGYRRADVDFANMVTSSSANSYTAGGVRVNIVRDVSRPGALTTTGSSTDISVAGQGFLPVTTAAQIETPAQDRSLLLTGTGSFNPNDEGYLVTPSGLALLGWPTSADGSLPAGIARDSGVSLEPVRLAPFLTAAESTTSIQLGVNLPAGATQAGASGATYENAIEYFDTLGNPQQLNVVYSPTVPGSGASNQWRVSFFDSASLTPTVAVAEYDVDFDATRGGGGGVDSITPVGGAGYSGTTGIATVPVAEGPIEVLIGASGIVGGLSQLAAEFAPVNVIKNGAPAGSLTTIEFDQNGFLNAVYDTGQRRTLYQIPMGAVPNPDALDADDNQTFAVSPESGDVYFWDPGTGPVGTLVNFALQESSVDVAQELTQLITTQRAYSSNATVIRTVDEMLQETTNLKR